MEFIAPHNNADEQIAKANEAAWDVINDGGDCKIVVTRCAKGTWPLLKLWRSWMRSVAQWQAKRGAVMPVCAPKTNPDGSIGYKVIRHRPFDEKDAHEAYSALLLGCDDRGVRYSWVINKSENQGRKQADLSRRMHAMTKMHQFCVDHGIEISIPDDSEYKNLVDRSES